MRILSAAWLALALLPLAQAQKRMVIVDQDADGPGGSNQMAILALLQSPATEVLGITVVTGDAWRDEEVQHTLRMLELLGRGDVPVVPGAVFPLVRTQTETITAEALYGKFTWLGAWGNPSANFPRGQGKAHGPWEVPPLREGAPHTKPLDEDAAHFLVRQVRAHPRQITIYEGGPPTNIALAISLDPHFAENTRGIVMMGGSLNPQTDDPEFATNPRHEFNFWFDPEATRIALRAPWPRIDVTTVDISIKAMFSQEMFDAISRLTTPAARYIAKYSGDRYYMWDELAACAWLDPGVITKTRDLYMDVDLSHGPSYGNTLTWADKEKPETGVRLAHAQVDLALPKFRKLFVDLMSHR